MLINLSEIMSVKDKIQHSQTDLTMDTVKVGGNDYKIIKKKPVELEIVNLNNKKVHIKADTQVVVLIPCSRCLEDVEYTFSISVEKRIDFNQDEVDRERELDEINYITDYDLDVDQLIYNEILLDFPLKILCKEDCKGICNQCGTNLNKSECQCENISLDPRMAVIRDLFNNCNS